MKIELREISVRDLVAGYEDRGDEGVVAYGGALEVRPPFQREFVYKDKQREAVIDTVRKGFPLNTMYWAVREDGRYEIIDGQQRTLSLCLYCTSAFSIGGLYFHNLTDDQQNQILDYKLTIYLCTGTASEKLDWFKTINIAGEQLTDQELRNAVYAGSWLSDAKRLFSKNACWAYNLGSKYMSGTPIRQDYLETVLRWITTTSIELYMAERQHEPNANELKFYFQDVITWVETLFPNYRKEMKGLPWGELYNKYHAQSFDAKALEAEVSRLMQDDDVTSKKGIYLYLLSDDERYLSIRTFSQSQKRKAYEEQEGVCPLCGEHFDLEDMEGDHITPWSEGGKTEPDNLQMLCKHCNRRKGRR